MDLKHRFWKALAPLESPSIDHLTQNFHFLAQGGADTSKQQCPVFLCVCLCLSHLMVNNRTKGCKIC